MKIFLKYFSLLSLVLFVQQFLFASSLPLYKLGVENLEYSPFYNTKNDNKPGACIEIIKLFAEKNKDKFKLEVTSLPVARLLQSFILNEVDFKFPDNKAWQQDKKNGFSIKYSAAVSKYTDGVMVLPANKGKGVENIKNLGTVIGFTAWDFLGLIKEKKVTVSESISMDSLLNKAMANKIDGAYLNTEVASYQLENTSVKDALVFDPSLPHTTDSYSLSSIKHPEIIDLFDKFLVSNNSEVNAIKAKYKLSE